jgi:hypothetical protein
MTTRPASGNKSPAKKTPVKRAAAKPAQARRSSSKAAAGTDADSPILPVEQLEGLHKIKPGAVDWVIEQTQIEAEHRRAETTRVNDLIFVEHLLGQIFALVIGLAGILGGSWVAVNGQPWFGFAIAAVVVIALAAVQLNERKKRP